jgi:hypothetical protein
MEISSSLCQYIRLIEDSEHPAHRITLAGYLIEACEEAIESARSVRNSAVRELCAEVLSNGKPRGPAETARLLGMKLPTVKAINRRD